MSSESDDVKIPEGAVITLPAEKLTPQVKKERTEAQKAAFSRMRAKRLENDKKRRLTKEESQTTMDEVKIQQEKEEEEERLRIAEELKKKYAAEVVIKQKRGRKPGHRIPYGGDKPTQLQPQAPPQSRTQPVQPQAPPQYTNPYMMMLQAKMRR